MPLTGCHWRVWRVDNVHRLTRATPKKAVCNRLHNSIHNPLKTNPFHPKNVLSQHENRPITERLRLITKTHFAHPTYTYHLCSLKPKTHPMSSRNPNTQIPSPFGAGVSKFDTARLMYMAGDNTQRSIAKTLKVSERTVYSWIKNEG